MNENIKTKWVEALRSGEYKQGQRALYKDGRFCCLGVLCDLAAKDGIVVRFDEYQILESKSYYGEYPYDPRASSGVLPIPVSKWADLTSNPKVNNKFLINLNDSGTTFSEIADLIEEYL